MTFVRPEAAGRLLSALAAVLGLAGATAETEGFADGAGLVVAALVDSAADADVGADDAPVEPVAGWEGAAGLEGVP